MVCNCNNINPIYHRVVTEGSTVGATVALAVTNNTNIPNYAPFIFKANQGVINLGSVAAAPVDVTVGVNGAQIPVWNKYGEQIQSNEIPKFSRGYAVTEGTTPHVILIDIPFT